MELWIRSQDGKVLEKIDDLFIQYSTQKKLHTICSHRNLVYLGGYKTEERALQVIDEIQNKMKQQFLLKPTTMMNQKDILGGKNYFEMINDANMIVTDNNFEIEPINSEVIVYQMPKEEN